MDTEKLYGPYIDDGYRTFSERLTRIHDRPYLGVRLPVLKRLAAGLDSIDFPVAYHEDVLLRGFWIARQKLPFAERRKLLEDHLQYLMTWDEADTLAAALRIGKGEKDEAYAFFSSLLSLPLFRSILRTCTRFALSNQFISPSLCAPFPIKLSLFPANDLLAIPLLLLLQTLRDPPHRQRDRRLLCAQHIAQQRSTHVFNARNVALREQAMRYARQNPTAHNAELLMQLRSEERALRDDCR